MELQDIQLQFVSDSVTTEGETVACGEAALTPKDEEVKATHLRGDKDKATTVDELKQEIQMVYSWSKNNPLPPFFLIWKFLSRSLFSNS